jgi:hypothetical protein
VSVLITNTDHDGLTAGLRAAKADLDTAQETHRAIPARLPLGQVNPGQQVLDIQTKLITHAIRIAAFNTATTLARAIRVHTGYARANREAHTLIRQALTGSGDIDPRDGVLTVRLDPLPTRRASTAIAELCEHLTATRTRYPGTDLILRYEVKTRPHTKYHSMSRPLKDPLTATLGGPSPSQVAGPMHLDMPKGPTPRGVGPFQCGCLLLCRQFRYHVSRH